MDRLKVGDRVIVTPYPQWVYTGVIVGYQEERPGLHEFYYKVENQHGIISDVNPVKVKLDKEWYREKKINELLK